MSSRAANHLMIPKSYSRIAGAAVLFLAILTSTPLWGAKDRFPAVDDRWKRYRSEHFELYSRTDRRASRQLLQQLEGLHAFFHETMRVRERRPGVVTVFYFSAIPDFRAYTPPGSSEDLVGQFSSFPDGDVMALAAGGGEEIALQVMKSQYVTHLIGLAGQVPDWLRWGTGFLFSTVSVNRKEVVFGEADPYRRDQVTKRRAFSSEWVFGPGRYAQKEEKDIFHAHSWLLLHYLYLGQDTLPREKVNAFVDAVCNGAGRPHLSLDDRRNQLELLLGLSFAELDTRVEQYRKRGIFRSKTTRMAVLPDADTFEPSPITAAEIRTLLVELSLRTQRSAEARLILLHEADKTDAPPHVFEALGTDALMDGDPDLARQRWRRALEAGSDNPAIFHHLGALETRGWIANINLYSRLPPERAEWLRGLFQRSIARSPDQSQAYEYLAWVEATAPAPSIANVNLVQSKFETLENQRDTLIALALARLRLGDTPGALSLLDVLERGTLPSGAKQFVQQIRAYASRTPPPNTRQ
jgi:hypothetical protein